MAYCKPPICAFDETQLSLAEAIIKQVHKHTNGQVSEELLAKMVLGAVSLEHCNPDPEIVAASILARLEWQGYI